MVIIYNNDSCSEDYENHNYKGNNGDDDSHSDDD